MNVQWYPGHMTKAKRMMQENIRLIDVMVELVDARVPLSSRNPDIDGLARDKYRIIVLNKADMADEEITSLWETYYKEKGFYTARVNSRSGKGIREVKKLIMEACRKKKERDKKRGILNRPVRAMVAGIPNVGKSTFINSFAGKACTKTGNKPGVTKGKQWIKINRDVELLDTPGILWPKFEDQMVGLRLSWIGSIREEVLSVREVAAERLEFLKAEYPEKLQGRYEVVTDEDGSAMLETIARTRGCLLKGNQLDFQKAARLVLDEFRSVKLGQISLEKPLEGTL